MPKMNKAVKMYVRTKWAIVEAYMTRGMVFSGLTVSSAMLEGSATTMTWKQDTH
jgi:hypothetical protein